jgi:hypothetical protein
MNLNGDMMLRIPHGHHRPTAFPYTSGLTNYWPFDGNGIDIIGGNHFTDNGGSQWISGKEDRCISTVSQSYASASFPSTLNGAAYTISAWLYIPAGLSAADTRKSPCAQEAGSVGWLALDYTFHFSGTYLVLGHQRRAVGTSAAGSLSQQFAVPYSENAWYHCVGTFDEAVGSICYGNSVAGTPNTSAAAKTRLGMSAAFRVGLWGSTYYSVLVDEVAIWDFAADQTMVNGLYNVGNGVFY